MSKSPGLQNNSKKLRLRLGWRTIQASLTRLVSIYDRGPAKYIEPLSYCFLCGVVWCGIVIADRLAVCGQSLGSIRRIRQQSRKIVSAPLSVFV